MNNRFTTLSLAVALVLALCASLAFAAGDNTWTQGRHDTAGWSMMGPGAGWNHEGGQHMGRHAMDGGQAMGRHGWARRGGGQGMMSGVAPASAQCPAATGGQGWRAAE